MKTWHFIKSQSSTSSFWSGKCKMTTSIKTQCELLLHSMTHCLYKDHKVDSILTWMVLAPGYLSSLVCWKTAWPQWSRRILSVKQESICVSVPGSVHSVADIDPFWRTPRLPAVPATNGRQMLSLSCFASAWRKLPSAVRCRWGAPAAVHLLPPEATGRLDLISLLQHLLPHNTQEVSTPAAARSSICTFGLKKKKPSSSISALFEEINISSGSALRAAPHLHPGCGLEEIIGSL